MPVKLENIDSISPNSTGQVEVTSDLNLSGTPAPVYRINGIPLSLGGTPAGGNGQIQYNSSGVFGASPNLVWDNANTRLGIGIAVPAYTLSVAGDVNLSAGNSYRINGVAIGVPAGANTQVQWNNSGAFGATNNLVWMNATQRLGIGINNPQTNLHVRASGLSTMLLGDIATGGTIYFAATGDMSLGLSSFTTNATWTGSAWQQINSLISSWQVALRNTTAFDPTPSAWSIRYKDPFSLPDLFPIAYLSVLGTGNVGIGTDNPTARLDVQGAIRSSNLALPTAGAGVEIAFDPTAGVNTGYVQSYNRSTNQFLPLQINGGPLQLQLNGGPVGIGNNATILPDSNASTFTWLIVGPTTPRLECGIATVCGNTTTSGRIVGNVSFANYAIAGAEKRIAEVSVLTDGAPNSGQMIFNTRQVGGLLIPRMRIAASGNVGIGVGTANDDMVVTDKLIVADYLAPVQFRIAYGAYGAFWRNDGSTLYLMTTNEGDPFGPWKSPWPMQIDFSSNNTAFGGQVRVGLFSHISTFAGDLSVSRSADPGTAVIYFGNPGQAFIYYDGNRFSTSRDWAVNGAVDTAIGYRINGVPISTGGVSIQHNGNLVGTRPIINFQNGATTVWVGASDDAGNNRIFMQLEASSDARLKQNIAPLDGGLSVINQLQPVSFEWNGLCGMRVRPSASLLAQDLQKVLPDAVFPAPQKLHPEDEETTDILCWDPHQVLAHALLAIQQMDQRLKALETNNNPQ